MDAVSPYKPSREEAVEKFPKSSPWPQLDCLGNKCCVPGCLSCDADFAKAYYAEKEAAPAPKGKQDFNGSIDGAGYKASMDNPAKPPVDLVPPTLPRGIARVLGKGAQKYSRGNWMRGMSYSEVIAAAERHLLAIKEGEDIDPESGELHIYHLGCELAFLSWYMDGPRKAEYARFDDRIFKHR
jgi:hypothetical protein